MRVPIQTGKKQFTDSFGNTQDVTIGSALGPLPDADESTTGPRFQPVRVWGSDEKGHDPHSMGPQPQPAPSGYTSPVDLTPAPQMTGTDGQPVEHAGSDNHPLNRRF